MNTSFQNDGLQFDFKIYFIVISYLLQNQWLQRSLCIWTSSSNLRASPPYTFDTLSIFVGGKKTLVKVTETFLYRLAKKLGGLDRAKRFVCYFCILSNYFNYFVCQVGKCSQWIILRKYVTIMFFVSINCSNISQTALSSFKLSIAKMCR